MDILTLGLWEIVGTPVEGFQGDTKRLSVSYDENDYVTHIGPVAAPPKQPKPEPEQEAI